MTQEFGNHRYTPKLTIVAFVSTATALVLMVLARLHISKVFYFKIDGLMAVSILCLCVMSRQYITALQDRIIKMEMRYRTDKFLSADQRKTLWGLTKRQIIALRFASDAEMPALVDRAAKEGLSGTDIKKAIKDWQGDHDRT
jgi:hypothetical protein